MKVRVIHKRKVEIPGILESSFGVHLRIPRQDANENDGIETKPWNGRGKGNVIRENGREIETREERRSEERKKEKKGKGKLICERGQRRKSQCGPEVGRGEGTRVARKV